KINQKIKTNLCADKKKQRHSPRCFFIFVYLYTLLIFFRHEYCYKLVVTSEYKFGSFLNILLSKRINIFFIVHKPVGVLAQNNMLGNLLQPVIVLLNISPVRFFP